MMSSSVPSDAPMGVYIRKQKAAPATVARQVDDEESSFGIGVGMHSPTMQRGSNSFVLNPSIAKSGLVASRIIAASATRRVSFGLQSAVAQLQIPRQQSSITSVSAVSAVDSIISLQNEYLGGDTARDQSAFLKLFSSATQREVDVCLQFAMHGGPLVKHSSRAHRAPALCTFRLTNDYARLVWADAAKPGDEKYGLETESLLQVLVGAAAAAEAEGTSAGPSAKSPSLRLVLLLEGEEKLRLEALDKVSLRYWAFALHFISEPKNKSRLLPVVPKSISAPCVVSKSEKEDTSSAAQGNSSGQITARSSAKATYNNYSESQLSVVRAFFSKARHGRLDALVQMLDAGMVSVDAVDEHGNTILMVAAQNNNKKICKAVLRRGANIDHQNRMGQTCLHFAFSLGYTALGEYLILKGGSETLRNTYGLSCRQGLAPHNPLQSLQGAAVRSPVHGYVTQRGDRIQHQQQQQSQSTAPKLLLPADSQPAHDYVHMRSGSSAGGFATDRPSPSAQRQRLHHNVSSSGIEVASIAAAGLVLSKSPASKLVLGACQDAFNVEKDNIHGLQSYEDIVPAREPELNITAICVADGNESSSGKCSSDLDGYHIKSEEKDHLNKQMQHQHSVDVQHQRQRSEQVEILVPAAKTSATASAPATPDRLSMVVSRATAALAASGALSRELYDGCSPSTVAVKPSPLTTSWQATVQSCSSPGLPISQRPLSFAVDLSDDSASDCSSSSGCEAAAVLDQFHTNLLSIKSVVATATPPKADISNGISLTIPASANTAPILLIRHGSSNSSSGSANGSRVESFDNSNSFANTKLDAGFFVDGLVGTSHRQKLRSGNIGSLRPTSAGGGTRKGVRPDLASGLGFKSIEVQTSRKSADHIRMPPRPSTPVLARHASTEEEFSFQKLAFPQSPGLASSAVRTRVQTADCVHQKQSPLSTARVAWGSPGK